MAEVSIKLLGVDETNRKLMQQHEAIAEKIRKPVLKYAQQVVKEYREHTPVGPTGNLRRAIGQRIIKQSKTAYFIDGTARTVFPRAKKNMPPEERRIPGPKKGHHRNLVAYGTSIRKNRKGANRGKMPANREFASVSENVDKLPFDIEIMKLLEEDVII